MTQADALPRALVYDRRVPGSQGRFHQVYWFNIEERPDLAGDDHVRGCCDCTGFFIEFTVRGKRAYVCPHMSARYERARAERIRLRDEAREQRNEQDPVTST